MAQPEVVQKPTAKVETKRGAALERAQNAAQMISQGRQELARAQQLAIDERRQATEWSNKAAASASEAQGARAKATQEREKAENALKSAKQSEDTAVNKEETARKDAERAKLEAKEAEEAERVVKDLIAKLGVQVEAPQAPKPAVVPQQPKASSAGEPKKVEPARRGGWF